jgi:hypothetical protein
MHPLQLWAFSALDAGTAGKSHVLAESLRITPFPRAEEAPNVDNLARQGAESAQNVTAQARQAAEEPPKASEEAHSVDKVQSSPATLMFYRLRPTSHGMRTPPSGLLVGLDDKLKRTERHWVAVDEALPPAHPLVLLSGVSRGGLHELRERLPGLRGAVDAAELDLELARSGYGERKAVLHRWLRDINIWMRASYRWTPWFALVRRVPVRGQSYQHWWEAAINALGIWRGVVAAAPVLLSDGTPRPVVFSDGRTLNQFEEVVREFEAARWAVNPAEVDLELARGALELAQKEGTALLMAYGHGVRARLGPRGQLVRRIPQVWPKHKPKRKAA